MSRTQLRRKSKRERQAWWRNLTPEEQSAYIEKSVGKKMEARRAKRIAGSVKDLANNCKNCVHGICGGCRELEDFADRRCTDWMKI